MVKIREHRVDLETGPALPIHLAAKGPVERPLKSHRTDSQCSDISKAAAGSAAVARRSSAAFLAFFAMAPP